MFSHVMVGTNDLAASKKFYDAVLGAIGISAGQADPKGRIFYRTKTGVFGITKPIDGKAATHANGGTIGFTCASPEQAKVFRDAAVRAVEARLPQRATALAALGVTSWVSSPCPSHADHPDLAAASRPTTSWGRPLSLVGATLLSIADFVLDASAQTPPASPRR
jgi:catechol 2,3-dioxygenase-like lactoylglutathione lyase family enzyme